MPGTDKAGKTYDLTSPQVEFEVLYPWADKPANPHARLGREVPSAGLEARHLAANDEVNDRIARHVSSAETADNMAVSQHRGPVRDLADLVDVMGNKDHARAFRNDPSHQPEQLLYAVLG